jgi:protein RPN4
MDSASTIKDPTPASGVSAIPIQFHQSSPLAIPLFPPRQHAQRQQPAMPLFPPRQHAQRQQPTIPLFPPQQHAQRQQPAMPLFPPRQHAQRQQPTIPLFPPQQHAQRQQPAIPLFPPQQHAQRQQPTMPLFPPQQHAQRQQPAIPQDLFEILKSFSAYSTSSQVTQQEDNFSIGLPGIEDILQQYSFVSHSRKQMNLSRVTEDFPATLTSMESSKTPESKKPPETSASTGTYTCTYHGCTFRLDTLEKLLEHKRTHRKSAAEGGETSAEQRRSQTGPRKVRKDSEKVPLRTYANLI